MSRANRAHWVSEALALGATRWWIDDASTEEIERNVNAIRQPRDGDQVDRDRDRRQDPFYNEPPINDLRVEAGGMTDE